VKKIETINYDIPKYIYIPFKEEEKLQIKETKEVYVGDFITNFDNKNIYSSVSGKIVGKSNYYFNNENINGLVIENDKKDMKIETNYQKSFFDLGKNDIKKLMQDNNLEKDTSKIVVLKINYIKNYDISDYYKLKEKTKEVLNALNKISYAYELKKVYILVNKKDKLLIKELNNYLVNFPNIDIITKLKSDSSEYNLDEIIKLSQILNKKNVSRHIYLTINYNKRVLVVKLRRYSLLKDLLEYLNIVNKKCYNINNELLYERNILDDKIKTIIIK